MTDSQFDLGKSVSIVKTIGKNFCLFNLLAAVLQTFIHMETFSHDLILAV